MKEDTNFGDCQLASFGSSKDEEFTEISSTYEEENDYEELP